MGARGRPRGGRSRFRRAYWEPSSCCLPFLSFPLDELQPTPGNGLAWKASLGILGGKDEREFLHSLRLLLSLVATRLTHTRAGSQAHADTHARRPPDTHTHRHRPMCRLTQKHTFSFNFLFYSDTCPKEESHTLTITPGTKLEEVHSVEVCQHNSPMGLNIEH